MIKSYSIVDICGSNYIEIFLTEDFNYTWKVGDQEKKFASIYLKEPERKDNQELRKVSIILNKMLEYKDKEFLKDVEFYEKALEVYKKALKDSPTEKQPKVEEDADPINDIINEVRSIFEANTSNDSFFDGIDYITSFINNKIYRKHDGDVSNISFDIFNANKIDNYKKEALIKEIAIMYIGFFLKHFPSKVSQVILG